MGYWILFKIFIYIYITCNWIILKKKTILLDLLTFSFFCNRTGIIKQFLFIRYSPALNKELHILSTKEFEKRLFSSLRIKLFLDYFHRKKGVLGKVFWKLFLKAPGKFLTNRILSLFFLKGGKSAFSINSVSIYFILFIFSFKVWFLSKIYIFFC